MAKLRVGFGSDFNITGQKVGLGTANPTALLEVAETAKADFNITGVTTLTSYGGFVAQNQNITEPTTIKRTTSKSGTLDSVNERETGFTELGGVHHGDDQYFNTLSEDLVVEDGKIFSIHNTEMYGDTTSGKQDEHTHASHVSAGSLEQVSVTGHFSVPCGGINERQETPIEGTVRFNDDLNTLEFFNGVEWRQFTYNQGQSGRAVFFGGYLGSGATRTKSMDLITIPTLGNSVYFGDLESARTDTQGCSDGTRGLSAGGYHPARLTDTEYITLASAGNSIQFGDLDEERNAFGGCSSSTRGLFAGGVTDAANVPSTSQIDYFQISTLGTALEFGQLTSSRTVSGGLPSSTRAVWGVGSTRSGGAVTAAITKMDYSTFASKGNATEFGDDILPRQTGNGCSSGTRGVFAGGYGSPAIYSSPAGKELGRKMSYITIASTGNAIEFGELSGIRTYIGSNSTSTRGIWTGGSQYPTHYDSIEYVQFSSLGNALDFGNLHSTKGYMTGSASDSHGGLGGF